MWNKEIWFALAWRIKDIQFRLKTWQQGREIARAYGESAPFHVRRVIRIALLGVVLCFTASGVIYVSKHYDKTIVSPMEKIHRWLKAARSVRTTAVPHSSANKARLPAASESTGVDSAREKTLTAAHRPQTDSAKAALAAAQALEIDTVRQRLRIPTNNGLVSETMDYCIIANKADRTLHLLYKVTGSGSESWKSIEHFPILVGRNDGQKVTAGDGRTPEGTYFIVGRKESEELDAIYGPLAYMLNYPNDEDRKAGRTGQGIWIHGTREDTTREATRGCVVLNNNDLLTLAHYLQLGIGTPVIIVNSDGLTPPEGMPNYVRLRAMRGRILHDYHARRIEFEDLLSQWKQAWESRNIDSYSRFYDSVRFFGEGMRWEAWREKKQRTFQAYRTISIGMEKISVCEFSESTAVILFLQRYESDVYRVQRPKKLSFWKSEGRWKIFKEETFSRQELLL